MSDESTTTTVPEKSVPLVTTPTLPPNPDDVPVPLNACALRDITPTTVFLVCGPADPMTPVVPVEDVCLPTGQMSRSMFACDPTTGQVFTYYPGNGTIDYGDDSHAVVAVAKPPVPTLPNTGMDLGAPVAGTIVMFLGLIVCAIARRRGTS